MGDRYPAAPNDAAADVVWDKIMVLAGEHALIVQAYGGSATLATPAAQRDAGIRNKCLRMVRFKEEEEKPETSKRRTDKMAKSKTKRSKSTDGDDLIDDDAPSVATAKRPDRAKDKQSTNGTAPKAQTKKSSSKIAKGASKPKASTRRTKSGRKTGPAASKPKAQTKKQKAGGRTTGPAANKAKEASSERTAFKHTTPKAGSKFERVYKGKTYKMTVKAAAKADLGVVFVYQGKSYDTPHDAADAVLRVGKDRATGTNGWFFWGISKRPARK